MRIGLLVAVTAAALTAGCQDKAAAPTNEAAPSANSAAAAPPADSTPNAVLGASVAGDQAKALMKERHEGMEDIGDAFKAVNAQIKGASPDLAAIKTHAATIATGAEKSVGWFPPGTGPDVAKTRAKADIWQKPQDFAAKDATFQTAARAFKAAADSGNLDAIKAQAGDLGKACKACHDPYRAPEGDHD